MKPMLVMTFFTWLSFVFGCGQAPQTNQTSDSQQRQLTDLTQAVVITNAQIAYAVYSDSVSTAEALQTALQAFVDNPQQATFEQAKRAWLASREPYGQSEVYRFRGGPIDNLREDGVMAEGEGPEGRINAWPLGEALIDYVAAKVDGQAGPESPANSLNGNLIANVDQFPDINTQVLLKYFEHGEDERNVTTGYHAIEFLLWGQDLNADGSAELERDNTPGQRPFSDYLTNQGKCTSGNQSSPEIICQRRADYLLAAAALLVDDLTRIKAAWHPETGEHYQAFVAKPKQSLSLILEGMGRLSFGELAGERINIALSTDSQEDEHSCFSDNTHRDILLNALGIQNSFLGRYTRADGSVLQGTGIAKLLKASGQTKLAEQMQTKLAITQQAAEAIDTLANQGKPFDVLIQQGVTQPEIRAIIAALVAQTESVEQIIGTLELQTGELRQDTEQDLSI